MDWVFAAVRCGQRLAEQDVDRRHRKAGDGDVEVAIELAEVLQPDRETAPRCQARLSQIKAGRLRILHDGFPGACRTSHGTVAAAVEATRDGLIAFIRR
jgi:hypothetical protein